MDKTRPHCLSKEIKLPLNPIRRSPLLYRLIHRILVTSAGILLILVVLLTRGLPVAMVIRAIPLALLVLVAISLIYAGLSND